MPIQQLGRLIWVALVLGIVPLSAAAQSPGVGPYPTDPVPLYRSVPPNGPGSGGMPGMVGMGGPAYGPPSAHGGNTWPTHGGSPMSNQPVGSAPACTPCPQTMMPPDLSFCWSPPPPCPYVYDGSCQTCECFVSAGWYSLKRQSLGDGVVAVFDTTGVDDGVAPPPDAPVAATYDDLKMELLHGFRVAAGFITNGCVFEATGFYIPEQQDDVSFVRPGQLTSFFFNPPVGFEGNNFLWDNADAMELILRSRLINGELNYRFPVDWAGAGLELLVGARYVDLQEELVIDTNDDGIQFGTDTTEAAAYISRTHNALFGGQLGLACHRCFVPGVGVSGELRGGWFVNNAKIDIRLERADGLVGMQGEQSAVRFSHVYDAGLYLDLYKGGCRVRAGYNVMWMGGVAEAVDQVDFNLQNTQGRGDYDGSILYHGPMVLVDFSF